MSALGCASRCLITWYSRWCLAGSVCRRGTEHRASETCQAPPGICWRRVCLGAPARAQPSRRAFCWAVFVLDGLGHPLALAFLSVPRASRVELGKFFLIPMYYLWRSGPTFKWRNSIVGFRNTSSQCHQSSLQAARRCRRPDG